MKVDVVRSILEANDRIAIENRNLFRDKGLRVINLMSAPGAGKTSLLERTIDSLKESLRMAVIEGDIQSSHDAEKIASRGIPAVQINTGGACHLDANMIRCALEKLDLDDLDLLIIENVGNLVCPAEFKVGEDFKVMMLSITEGEDKPLKYPLMFRESSALLINKMDLLPHLDISMERLRSDSLKINPSLEIFEISCKTGDGLDEWFSWLKERAEAEQAIRKEDV